MSRLTVNNKTLDEIRQTLEEFSTECLVRSRASKGREAELLREVVESIELTRERLLDVSIAVAKYVSYCLEHDPIHEISEVEP